MRVNSAVDEKVEEDIKADIQSYQKQYPDAKVELLKIAHPSYWIASTLFVRDRKSYEYVTYVAPKPFIGKNISIAMNVQKRKANADELEVYKKLIASVQWLKK